MAIVSEKENIPTKKQVKMMFNGTRRDRERERDGTQTTHDCDLEKELYVLSRTHMHICIHLINFYLVQNSFLYLEIKSLQIKQSIFIYIYK